jgi:hypothetical protein
VERSPTIRPLFYVQLRAFLNKENHHVKFRNSYARARNIVFFLIYVGVEGGRVGGGGA